MNHILRVVFSITNGDTMGVLFIDDDDYICGYHMCYEESKRARTQGWVVKGGRFIKINFIFDKSIKIFVIVNITIIISIFTIFHL